MFWEKIIHAQLLNVADNGFLRMTGNNESFRLQNNMYVSQALVARTYRPPFFLTFLLQIYFQ